MLKKFLFQLTLLLSSLVAGFASEAQSNFTRPGSAAIDSYANMSKAAKLGFSASFQNAPVPGIYGLVALGMSGLFCVLVRKRSKTKE